MLYIDRPQNNPFQRNHNFWQKQKELIQKWLNNYHDQPQGWRSPALILENQKIREKFNQAFNFKCAYCEIKLGKTKLDKNQGEFNLFRPREVELQNSENKLITNYNYFYHWLSWEWSNFYLACHKCNVNKRTRFPVNKQRAKPGTYDPIELSKEEPLLLDPCFDNPSDHLIFLKDGTVHARQSSLRGKKTIEILDLNREELVSARKEEANKLIYIVNSSEKEFNKQVSEMNPSEIKIIMDELMPLSKDYQSFSAMKRELISELLDPFLRQIPDLQQLISPNKSEIITKNDSFTFSPNDNFIIIYNYYQYHSGSGDNLLRDKNTTNIYNSQDLTQTAEEQKSSQIKLKTQPKKSLLGLCADLGKAPSEEEIDSVRNEVWSSFPREDI